MPARRHPHSVFKAPSICFQNLRLSIDHPGSLESVHDLKCMRTQTAPLFSAPRGRCGTTTRVAQPYPYGTSRAGNRTWVIEGEVQKVDDYTMGPAETYSMLSKPAHCLS